MKVFVYWNLHKKCWSVRHKGKVIAHEQYVFLRDATYKVNENGRQRVLAKRKKEVHAGVSGIMDAAAETRYCNALFSFISPAPIKVGYNPYKGPTFMDKDKDVPIMESDSVFMCPNSAVYAYTKEMIANV